MLPITMVDDSPIEPADARMKILLIESEPEVRARWESWVAARAEMSRSPHTLVAHAEPAAAAAALREPGSAQDSPPLAIVRIDPRGEGDALALLADLVTRAPRTLVLVYSPSGVVEGDRLRSVLGTRALWWPLRWPLVEEETLQALDMALWTASMWKQSEDGFVQEAQAFVDEVACRALVQLELERKQTEIQGFVDELVQMNEDLRAARDLAQSADRAKTEFLTNMSHELRTPLNAILGFTRELRCGGTGTLEEREDLCAVIERSGDHLLRLIDDLLDISRIEARALTLRAVPTALRQVVGDTRRSCIAAAKEKGLELVTEVDASVPELVLVDGVRVRQIIHNLVENAIRYSAAGRITLRISSTPRSGGVILNIAVSDQGPGIDHDLIPHLFEPFAQADTSVRRRCGGAGLGLAIVRRVAQAMHGDVSVVSTGPTGTEMRVSLVVEEVGRNTPTAAATCGAVAAPPSTSAVPPLSGFRILYVEDGKDNQRLVSVILSKAGARVELADHGGIGVERALNAQMSGQPFDVILMDMQMPEMDGYTATRRLREAGFTLPIIALTAHAMVGDREKCIEAGCTEYQTKPIDRAKLVATILGVRALGTAAAAA